MTLKPLLAATLLALAYGQCVFNENECQCMEGQSGKICLRYFGGTAPNIQCEAYACGSGYICDCKLSNSYLSFLLRIVLPILPRELSNCLAPFSIVRRRCRDVRCYRLLSHTFCVSPNGFRPDFCQPDCQLRTCYGG